MKTQLICALTLGCIGFANLLPAPVFLKIEGVDGESQAVDREGWIEIDAFSVGATQADRTVVLQELAITKQLDKASPQLLRAMVAGEPTTAEIVVVRDIAGGPADFYTIKLEDVLISSVRTSREEGEATASEHISLNFEKITVTHNPSGETAQFPPVVPSKDEAMVVK